MTENNGKNESLSRNPEQQDNSSGAKKSRRPLLVLFAVFTVFVGVVFLTQDKGTIEWLDYEAGVKLAKEKDKPILLAVFKRLTKFCELMVNNTYNNPKVKEFVEDNFVPILIDVDLEPEIAEKYDMNYYPVHYVMDPNLTLQIGPQMGYEGSHTFIERLERFLKELNSKSK